MKIGSGPIVSCRKVLYGTEKLHVHKGVPADITVFSSSGGGPVESITDSREDTVMTVLGRTAVYDDLVQ